MPNSKPITEKNGITEDTPINEDNGITEGAAKNEKNGIIPDGANKAEKGVYEAGIMLEEISKYASVIGNQFEKIPGIGIIPELVTGIISSITNALSKLLESCVNIAIKHDNNESANQLQEQSNKLDGFANKYNLPNAKGAVSKGSNLMETNNSETENKQPLTKKQKIDDKVSEAGEMIAEFGPLINEVTQSLATIPGVGAIAMLIGSIAGPIVYGLGELIQKLASIDSQVNTNSIDQNQSDLSTMSQTKTAVHDSAAVLDFPSFSQKESTVDSGNTNNDINTSDIQETVGFAAQ